MYSVIECTKCGQPVTCGQGTRHLTCSPTCTRCNLPIPSKNDAGGNMHAACPNGKKTEQS